MKSIGRQLVRKRVPAAHYAAQDANGISDIIEAPFCCITCLHI